MILLLAVVIAPVADPPLDWPLARVHGVAYAHGSWAVGGLDGLATKSGEGAWATISKDAVRQMLQVGGEVFVLFGNGAVDKLNLGANRLYYDILHGAVRRPWTSVLAAGEKGVYFGGYGGWIAKSAAGLREVYPRELAGQTVTALAEGPDGAVWIGTQKQGLWRHHKNRLEKFGLARGLPDPWVTALAFRRGELFVGTASGGVVKLQGRELRAVETTSLRVRSLTSVNGQLGVGSLEGTWLESKSGWTAVGSEETTCLASAGGHLWLGEPRGLRRIGK